MKKMMFAMAALVASSVAVNAQENNTTTPSTSAVPTEQAAPAEQPAPADQAAPSDQAVSSEQTVSLDQASQGDKVKIQSDELPEAVKKSLETQDNKGWLINAAYQNKKDSSYEVELKNGAETKTVKFDKEGKKID